MYGFAAPYVELRERPRGLEGVHVYDKCEIPFRDDYVLLSFGWVTNDPSILPISCCLSEGKKGSGICWTSPLGCDELLPL